MRFLIFSFLSLSTSLMAFDWQGHRGARGLYPENTIGGMREALRWPVTTLELDVVISKDRKVVVSHEPWMSEEICKDGAKKKNIFKMTYEEIIKFDCGSKPHPRFPEQQKVVVGKPLLSELLKETKDSGKLYNIEIKSSPEDERAGYQPGYKEFTTLVMKEILTQIPAERFVIQSFDWRVLKFVRENWPSVRLSALSEELHKAEAVVKELGFTPEIYSPYFKKLELKDVKAYHELKMLVIPWTVNTVEDMGTLIKMGVDGIITDYPNLIPKVLQKECKEGDNLFEGRCVNVPRHALPSDSNPGWICKPGYQQKRSKCVKIKLPPHSELTEDGKTWVCKEGYVRYRGTCKKK